jgi:hypothetical protein
MLWTAIGIGGIWVAVLLISLLAPDLVSGPEQQHLPVAAFSTWFWGGIGTWSCYGRWAGSGAARGGTSYLTWDRMLNAHTDALGTPNATFNAEVVGS